MRVRPNFAAGSFYASDQKELIRMIESNLKQEQERINLSLSDKRIIGGVVPHAGHVYCAAEAVHFFEIVRNSKQEFDVVILVNPNHTGKGLPLSIDDHAYWSTPLGHIEVDRQLAEETGIPFDIESQEKEHSGEVIVPYIQYFLGDKIKFLPVSFGAQNEGNAQVLASVLYDACKKLNRKPLFIASSDFNHFAPPEIGKELDDYALEALLRKDCPEFAKRVRDKNISICGFGTIMTLLDFARLEYGDFNIKVLRQGHSGEVQSMPEVVDYVSILVYTNKQS